MAEYKGIKGFKVQYLSADPSNPIIGQTWYNSTSKDLKYQSVTTTPSWASATNYPANMQRQASFGTQTATVNASGLEGAAYTTNVKEYDGTTWTAGGSVPTALEQPGGGGILTAGFMAGGETPAPAKTTETVNYDGTSWALSGSMATGRSSLMSGGTQTAGIIAGGGPGIAPSFSNATEEYNGATWTTGGTLPTAVRNLRGFGLQTAAITLGGELPPATPTNATSEYNGTSWSGGGNLAATATAMDGEGTLTAGVAMGGGPAVTTVQLYDGTSWSPTSSMSNARTLHGASGASAASSLAIGGASATANLSAVEEFNGPGLPQTKTVTVS